VEKKCKMKKDWKCHLVKVIATMPCSSLGNTSEEIRSNRPYLSFCIWLYHFNFVILMNRKTHFNSLCFIII
jgi:hypothetical protein